MDRRRRLSLAASCIGALWLAAAGARADEEEDDGRPTLGSDAVWIGGRIGPGAALFAAWDLDFYLSDERAISLGPGVSVAIGGDEVPPGMQQQLLVTVDALRLKIGASTADGALRPWAMIAGGVAWVRLEAAEQSGVSVLPEGSTTPVVGTRRWGELEQLQGVVGLGFGIDAFFEDSAFALTTQVTSRFRLSGTDRVPDTWVEIALGLRVGT